jgi:hypothetical protein
MKELTLGANLSCMPSQLLGLNHSRRRVRERKRIRLERLMTPRCTKEAYVKVCLHGNTPPFSGFGVTEEVTPSKAFLKVVVSPPTHFTPLCLIPSAFMSSRLHGW